MPDSTNKLGTVSPEDYLKAQADKLADTIAPEIAGDRATLETVIIIEEPTTTVSDTATAATVGATGTFLVTEGPDVLRLHLPFENSATDTSENNLTVAAGSSITYTAGLLGSIADNFAASFPQDNNGYVTVTDDAKIRVAAAFSLSLWVKPTSIAQDGATNVRLINKYDDASNQYILFFDSTGIVAFSCTRAGVTNSVITTSGKLAAGTTTHIAVTYNAGTCHVYINGTLSDNSTTGVTASSTTTNMIIGKAGTLNVGRYKGLIDGLRKYDIALSSTQVTNLYNNKKSIYDPPGVSDYSDTAA